MIRPVPARPVVRGLAGAVLPTVFCASLVFSCVSLFASASAAASEAAGSSDADAVSVTVPAAQNLPLSLNPDARRQVTTLYGKGNRLLDAKRYAEAERAFLDALKLAPEIPAIHHGLGLVYIQTQDYELAVLHLENALRSDPDQPKTLYALSKAYALVGENEKAEEGYRRVLVIDPNFVAAHQELAGIYYRQKKWEEAFASLDRAQALNPKSAHTLMLMGVTAVQSGRADVALDAVTRLRAMGQPDRARRLEYLIFLSKQEAGRN